MLTVGPRADFGLRCPAEADVLRQGRGAYFSIERKDIDDIDCVSTSFMTDKLRGNDSLAHEYRSMLAVVQIRKYSNADIPTVETFSDL